MAIPGSILPVFSAVNISVRMIIAPPNSRSMSFGLPYRETMPLKSRRKYSTNPIAARHIAIYSAFNSFLSVFWNIIRKQTTIAKPRCILLCHIAVKTPKNAVYRWNKPHAIHIIVNSFSVENRFCILSLLLWEMVKGAFLLSVSVGLFRVSVALIAYTVYNLFYHTLDCLKKLLGYSMNFV